MTRVLGAERVPAGFTITTEACVAYMEAGREVPEGLDGAGRRGAGARWRSRPASGWATPTDPLLVSVRSGARESMPGMLDTVLNLGLNDESVEGLAARDRATSASRGTPTGASCRCSATSCAASRASASRTRSRRVKQRARRQARHRARRRRAARARRRRSSELSTTSRPTRASSSRRRSAPSSTPGWASARSPTGASTASPTTGARRSTSSRWSSATRATRRAPASPSAATRSPARPSRPATSCVNAQGEDVVSGVRNTQRHRRARPRSCPRRTRS